MTLSAFVGAGGLGYLVFSGVQTVNNTMILAGAIPACILALCVDFVFSKIEVVAIPDGISTKMCIRDRVITECKRLGIKHVTLYTFSTENWKRPALEVETLMTLLQSYLKKEVEELNINNVKLTAIGDIEKLPKSCLDELKRAMELTKDNDGPNLNLALNLSLIHIYFFIEIIICLNLSFL